MIGLDSFAERKAAKSAKRKRQKEKKRLAKLSSSRGAGEEGPKPIETIASKTAKTPPVLAEVIEYKDPRKRKRKHLAATTEEASPPSRSAKSSQKQVAGSLKTLGSSQFLNNAKPPKD